MRIVAFIPEAAPAQRILDPIGEPAAPPRIAPARGPPSWEEDDCGAIFVDDRHFSADPLAQLRIGVRVRSAHHLVSGTSPPAEVPVVCFLRSAVSCIQKAALRHLPPSRRVPHRTPSRLARRLAGPQGKTVLSDVRSRGRLLWGGILGHAQIVKDASDVAGKFSDGGSNAVGASGLDQTGGKAAQPGHVLRSMASA